MLLFGKGQANYRRRTKQAATDLIAALTHDIELGLAEGKVAIIVTRDMKGLQVYLMPCNTAG